MAVRIQVLGSLRAWRDGEELNLGPPGRRAVLGLLVLGNGETVTTRELVDALWGDQPPRSVVNVLQTHVKHLRRLLEPDRPPRTGSAVLPHVNGGYAVNQDAVDVDLAQVRRLLVEANNGGTNHDTELLGEVLRLCAVRRSPTFRLSPRSRRWWRWSRSAGGWSPGTSTR